MNWNRRSVGLWALLGTCAVTFLGGCTLFGPRLAMDPRRARIDARTALYQAADDPDVATRVHGIEAMAEVLGERASGVFVQNLDDASPVVRFAAAMAIGDIRHAQVKPKLLVMAGKGEPNKLVFIAVAYALARLDCLSSAAGTELGKMLTDQEKDVRGQVALVMGKMGEVSAIAFLKAVLEDEREPMVRLQIIESLAMLGDERSASVLEAFTKSQFMDERLVAIPAMAKARYRRAPIILRGLLDDRQPPPVRVAAAGALAMLGEVDGSGYLFCVSAAQDPQRVLASAYGGARQVTPTDVTSLQGLAAISLGWMKQEGAVQVLHPLLQSKEGGVRVAAAMAILRLLGTDDLEAARPGRTGRPGSEDSSAPPKTPKLRTAGGKD